MGYHYYFDHWTDRVGFYFFRAFRIMALIFSSLGILACVGLLTYALMTLLKPLGAEPSFGISVSIGISLLALSANAVYHVWDESRKWQEIEDNEEFQRQLAGLRAINNMLDRLKK